MTVKRILSFLLALMILFTMTLSALADEMGEGTDVSAPAEPAPVEPTTPDEPAPADPAPVEPTLAEIVQRMLNELPVELSPANQAVTEGFYCTTISHWL